MDIQWSMIWTQSNGVATKSRKRHDAFADPLERSEWEGLGWSVFFVSRLISGAHAAQNKRQKIREVERFTDAACGQTVCVS